MYEGTSRARAETEYRRRATREGRRGPDRERRPDRIALWAVVMAVVGMVAAAASAHAGTGGTGGSGGGGGTGSGSASSACPDARFGARALRVGDCGDDVKTLHWILRADSYGVPMTKSFGGSTAGSVRRFQRHQDLGTSGVVGHATRKHLIHTMPKSVASWYGPGLFGRRTACGIRLKRNTIGVAHRHLPCGTKVTLKYHGHFTRAEVIDRGPYVRGVRWDLTKRTAKRLNFTYTDTIRAAPID
jgi:Putative peptidoglycan binding domain/Lytic transglycolase